MIEVNNNILPIGSIITVAENDVMICSYFKKGKKINGEEYDYACCLYPSGLDKNAILVKKENIQRVKFIGFQDNRFVEFKKQMEDNK